MASIAPGAEAAWKDLCIDAVDELAMLDFWAAALGFEAVRQPGHSRLVAPGGGLVWINAVAEPRTVKNRVHPDVHCGSVDELLAIGATVLAPPGDDRTWWQLASPEGDELCAFVRDVVPENRLYEIGVDAVDGAAQAEWWAARLGGEVEHADGWSAVASLPGLPAEYLVFGAVPEPKTVKNRVHWDVSGDVATFEAAGATLLRPRGGDISWAIMADPEGNEFCVFD